ncbi:methylenetetrahydrofolate--tRNA-(uracil(54)-C(5))-methyltransferase (FADH(2)-oxidizing) TrmFO [candidate division WOR-3 bacterium]|nr:methylenetetrahydrofolate--tRNA-(uracil(54)-C(5))-methyltransferase (FADH(2)-oxidizing) TrmFO [candidate division WOR-3 bacterium]
MPETVNIAGAGLAGCEAAWQIAEAGFEVNLFESRPKVNTGAHKTDSGAELVCSNSFKSTQNTNAHGLLKQEMKILNSLILNCAEKTAIPGGKALVVDREKFSDLVTSEIIKHKKINFIREEVKRPSRDLWIIATGPLSSESISLWLRELTGRDFLYFTDAMSPIVELDEIDLETCYMAGRYGFGDDYLNCPFDENSYNRFWHEIVKAEKIESHFDENVFFQGCMPVEEIAAGGSDSLRFGLMKPKGLINPKTGKEPFAVCQLRRENQDLHRWNLVGFQTRLKWPEQKRVFSKIPGLDRARFVRYGQAHRNTYINSPRILRENSFFIGNTTYSIAGQLCGVEGYSESAATGLLSAFEVLSILKKVPFHPPPKDTMSGGLLNYIHTVKGNFQPSAANFSLLEGLSKIFIKKTERKKFLSDIALESMENWKEHFVETFLTGKNPR